MANIKHQICNSLNIGAFSLHVVDQTALGLGEDKFRLLLGVKETGHVTIEHRLIKLLFYSSLVPLSFCSLLFHINCLLHQVRAQVSFTLNWSRIIRKETQTSV